MDFSYPHIHHLVTHPVEFKCLIDAIPLGILVLDPDRRVVSLNRTFQALSGFSLSDARGIHCRNILRSTACIYECPILKMTHDDRPVFCESDMINLDRQHFPIRMTTAPIIDINGKTAGFIETIEDIRTSQTFDTNKGMAYSFANIIGRSHQMEKIFQTLPVLAQSDTSVLITGETGTGKDLVAEAIHQTSGRASGPFIKINCGALPETLLESEIFGHQKGAFTGAVENKPGRFRLAHNGTIFLTEIGDLPISLQVKLLTFLDDKIIYPLGSTKGFKANVRMVTATHRDLELMVSEGRFRKDLLFRLNVARIHLPPLRERDGDIRLLLDYFFNTYKKQLAKRINGFSREVLTRLLNYDYEGNIRELKNIVEYAVNIATGPMIEVQHLPAYLVEEPPTPGRAHADQNNNTVFPDDDEYIGLNGTMSGKGEWALAEKKMILKALIQARGKKTKAAQILGWGRSTLWRKIKHHKLE
ncbi:MAG: PAS domain-containing protein [Deltaproteobacteria bacterium]|nr:PAS domain-containing protein [Deltaproteobacteria bacterium]